MSSRSTASPARYDGGGFGGLQVMGTAAGADPCAGCGAPIHGDALRVRPWPAGAPSWHLDCRPEGTVVRSYTPMLSARDQAFLELARASAARNAEVYRRLAKG